MEWTALNYLTVRYPIWVQWFVEKVVLASGHCNQYYICIQLGGCIVPSLVKLYHRKFSDSTLWVSRSGNQGHASLVLILVQHKEADKLRYDELGHYPIRCSVHKCAVCGKSCCSSCEKCNQGFHVKTRFQIFHEKWQYDDITITFVILITSKC